MSEFKLFYRENGRLRISKDIHTLKNVQKEDILWIDLNDVEVEVESELEQFLKIYIQEEEEMEEIEISSRYIQTEDSMVANSHFLLDNYSVEAVSFIVKSGILVSVRDAQLKSFDETLRKIFANQRNFPTGYHVLVALFETRVEYDADMIEDVTDEVSALSKRITSIDSPDEDLLLEIKNLQEKIMVLRQNIIDKQRIISNMIKCELIPEELRSRLSVIIKDVNSLFEYTRFGVDRLDYLQDTFLGLVNIQQNKIIKIFTVVSVIFLPPTLIESMYGMNFDFMPELHWQYGYLFAIFLMVAFASVILLIFKIKRWL